MTCHGTYFTAGGSFVWAGLVCSACGQLWLSGLAHAVQHDPFSVASQAAAAAAAGQSLESTGSPITTKAFSAKWSPW